MRQRCQLVYLALVMLTWVVLPASAAQEMFDCLIKPYVEVNIGSPAEGILETVAVDRGDLVQHGQVLARLESSVERATVARYRARATMESLLKINEARLELSTRQHARKAKLYQDALIPEEEMDEAETTRRLAELDLLEAMEKQRLAKLDLQRAMAELNRRTIKSPIAGVVVERLRHPGELADANPILRLAQLHPLRVEVFVPVAFLGQVTVDMPAEVLPEAPVGGVYEARVTVVDRVVDAASGMFGVRLELPNRDYELAAGLKCQVRFQLPTPSEAHATTPPRIATVEAPLAPPSRPIWNADVRYRDAARALSAPPAPPGRAREPLDATPAPTPRTVPPTASQRPSAPEPRPMAFAGNVKKGETASDLFLRAGIGTGQVIMLRQAIRSIYDIRWLQVGHPYRIELTPDGQIRRFTYQIDNRRRLEVERQDGTFRGQVAPVS